MLWGESVGRTVQGHSISGLQCLGSELRGRLQVYGLGFGVELCSSEALPFSGLRDLGPRRKPRFPGPPVVDSA